MTDRNARPGTAPPLPAITGNIRAELARKGMTAAQARGFIGSAAGDKGTGMASATWERRMRDPGTWKIQELESLAAALGVTVARLVAGE